MLQNVFKIGSRFKSASS